MRTIICQMLKILYEDDEDGKINTLTDEVAAPVNSLVTLQQINKN